MLSLATWAAGDLDSADASVTSGSDGSLSVWLSGDGGGASALGVGGAAGAGFAGAASAATGAAGEAGDGVVAGVDSLADFWSDSAALGALPRIKDATDGAVASRDTEVRSVSGALVSVDTSGAAHFLGASASFEDVDVLHYIA